MGAWYDVIRGACAEAIATYELHDVITPEVAGAWICHFWIGMELSMLAGFNDSDIGHRAALQAFEALLRRLDERHSSRARR